MVLHTESSAPALKTNLNLLSNRYILSPVAGEKFTSRLDIRKKLRDNSSAERHGRADDIDIARDDKLQKVSQVVTYFKLPSNKYLLPPIKTVLPRVKAEVLKEYELRKDVEKIEKALQKDGVEDKIAKIQASVRKIVLKEDKIGKAIKEEDEEELAPKIGTNLKLLNNRYILSAVGSERFTSHRELRKAMKEKTKNDKNQPPLEVVASKSDRMREKLLAGLHNIAIPTEMMRTGFKRVTFLPISTRGVGFYVQYLYGKFGRLLQSIQIEASPYQLYRLSLMQLEYRLCKVMGQQTEMINSYDLLPSKTLDLDYQITAKNLPFNLSPIANLIMSVGNFELNEKTYYPIIAPHVTDEKKRFIPEPTTVTFSNLRKVVEYLSDPLTDKHVRQMFYDHCPLPCALWGPKPILERRPNGTPFERPHHDFPLLLNPDDFIPKDYYQQQMVKKDVQDVTELFTNVERKYPKLISSCEIDYESEGCTSLLTCNKLENLRTQDVSFISGKPDLSSIKGGFDGEITGFWSPEVTSGEHLCLGAIKLLGEQRLHTPPKYLEKAYAVRAESAAGYVVAFSYTTILRLMSNQLLT
nr:PREDICTED: uncharacterized protein LOC109035912 [Bemisia tabaci]